MNATRVVFARQFASCQSISSPMATSGAKLLYKVRYMSVVTDQCYNIHKYTPTNGYTLRSRMNPISIARSFSSTEDSGKAVSNLNSSSVYDPYEITKSFEDTSYYYPPLEELDPKFLASKYAGMTNEELMDASTITADDAGNHTWESLMHSPPIRDKNSSLPKGSLVGKVVSTKMQKTVNVAVDRYKVHPKYRKRIRYTRKFMAHDENEVASDGDTVLIVPSQRISKKKHFVLREIIRAKGQL